MGFTGLARWINAPAKGLEMINENITRNHGGTFRGKWSLSIKAYRSIPPQSDIPGLVHGAGERIMCAVTMNDNVYVWIEDATAPARAEWLATEAEAAQNSAQSNGETTSLPIIQPPHYRTTYITATPPQSFDLLLTQLRAQWQSTRQSGGPGKANIPTIGGPQLVIEGNIFAIGTDWIVRAGNVIQVLGGNVKGMVLEAEYLPYHSMPQPAGDGTTELLSNLLTSLLPRIPDAKTVAVTIPPGQWDEMLYMGDPPDIYDEKDGNKEEEIVNDIFVHGLPSVTPKKGDWTGIDRDRKAAFLISGALRSEGLI